MKFSGENRIGILVSGSGTNMQALLDADRDNGLGGGSIRVVISNRPKAFALNRARDAGVDTAVVSHRKLRNREDFENEIIRVFNSHDVNLVILAGFMRVLTAGFLNHYKDRVVNIHPAILPSFPGVDGQGQAARKGVRISGCTVHFVDEGTDTGPVIIQAAVPHIPGEGRDSLQQRILAQEHRIFPQAVRWICEGRVWLEHGRVMYTSIPDASGVLISPPLDTDE